MAKKEKLKRILDKLAPFDVSAEDAFKPFEDELARISATFKETVSARTMEQVNSQFRQMRKAVESLPGAFEDLKLRLVENDKKLLSQLKERLAELTLEQERHVEMSEKDMAECESEMADIRAKIKEVSEREAPDLLPRIKKGEERLLELVKKVNQKVPNTKEILDKFEGLQQEVDGLRGIALKETHGGNANRQINVNSSVMSNQYTDINFQQFGNIGWSTNVDATNKRINIRASILVGGGGSGTPGGADKQVQYNDNGAFNGDPAFLWSGSVLTVGQAGSVRGAIDIAGATSQTVRVQVASTAGAWTLTLPTNDGAAGQYLLTDGNGITQWASVSGGSGITRSTSIITANTTGAEAASTDYVYFASATGITFTLPTAVGNTNLYTIKNFTGASVLVATSAGQTIDQSATALLPTMNESLTFISNSSVWAVV